jgi:CheY-like chemotaxis protein
MGKKILFVDDEADLLKVSSIRLRKTGYEVFEAKDGQEALDQARLRMPDLIVLDVFLPVMNGDEVARILKKDEKMKLIPIILISADVKTLEERAWECGANNYLAKVFGSGELVAMVKKYIA